MNALALVAISATTVAPVFAEDDHKGHGQKNHGKAPKNNGRHDNGLHKGWYKNRQRSNWSKDDEDSDWNRRQQQVRIGRQGQTAAQLSAQRQKTKNEWRNIALVSGAVAILGLLKKDNTLTFAGAAGALYSTYRYEQDRKSQNAVDRARATYFSRPYFVRDGQRFDRRTLTKGGTTYYQFVRHK
jgi:hypothetical protein